MYGCTLQIYNGFVLGETPIEVEMKEIKIMDILNYVSKGKIKNLQECESGIYPVISCSVVNNGYIKHINTYDYDGLYVTISGNGSAGTCFVQKGKFSASTDVHVLKLKDEYKYLESCLGLLAYIMTNKFMHIYNYSTKLNNARLMNETISLPTLDGKINENLLNAYVYEMMLM